eukprot:CAMPEP_0206421242 /NCGR_PEP_ID=MMETSP0324_2-20121206/1331_1 /ASSEMBLY_ACC=CAM_ASM_000836 /TAXON_ID=2866 /ORGANISM="Crypthecodinium cohnii, Strain Seligo" /LENGTH=102 /DNA_ID=CAMNT_0053885299 /DNA_START=225 /DNA_END=533 /DNA_ORIENTATION=+
MRMVCTLIGVSITTNPKLPGRMRGVWDVLLKGLTLEWATSTLRTLPYSEKCWANNSCDWKPMGLMRRTMKTQSGFWLCSSVRCIPNVCFVVLLRVLDVSSDP